MNDWIVADWPAPPNIVAGTTLRTRASNDLPTSTTPCWLNQVHGTAVVTAGSFASPPSADAVVNGDEEYAAVVRTADCLPVLICSSDGSRFAAAHAGWRGLAAGVVENTVAALGVDPDELLVWLGPAISQPAFEVGDEVRDAFVGFQPGASAFFQINDRQRWQADLYGLARLRLDAIGVRNIFGGGFCTFRDNERFFSYRRNAECGRMSSFVVRRTP